MRLAEHLAQGGCPLCASRAESEQRLVGALLGEAVNDVGVRGRLDRAGGFCSRHTRLLPDRERARRGGTMGASILLGAVAEARLERLRALEGASGRRLNGGIADLRRPADCPLCADVAGAGRSALVVLVGRLGDPAWVAALASAAFCLADLLAIWEVVARSDRTLLEAWRPIGRAQRERLDGIVRLARNAVAHAAHDRRDELTDEERVAVDRLADALA